MKDHELRSILTSWGVIRVALSTDGIVHCDLPHLSTVPREPFAVLDAGPDPVSAYVRLLLEGGHPDRPPVGRLAGSPFQERVWKGLLEIPRGETRSYSDLAARIGYARSARAVANACGRNPAPLFVPCHRVIRADGSPGGFSGGLAWKRLLLAAEQANH
jgi:O-6-methylguanine DNA methyltransferase